jgi:formate-dependent nitrite reductase membrane component NrfD
MSTTRELRMVERAEPRSYYGRPVIKPPVWKPQVPWYFFTGGLTGAASTFALMSQLSGRDRLAGRAWAVAMVAGTASPVLLITDLGRPERFLNMLRVFKITSPMSIGSWVVAVSGATNGVATATRVLGVMPRVGAAARAGAGLSGLPMATYTAVLIANTAVPAWHAARHELPFLFAASAAASAGAAVAIATPVGDAGPARRLAVIGTVGAQAASVAMHRRLGALARAYATADARRYGRIARASMVAGAAVLALHGRRSRIGAIGGGLAVLAGSAAERWSVFEAGVISARDPADTIGPQRARAGEPA